MKSSEELRPAMMFVWDIFDRGQIKYFMLGEIAKQLKEGDENTENTLIADQIEVGCMRGNLTYALYSLFREMLPEGFEEIKTAKGDLKKITFEYSNVPVVIRVFDKDYGVFGDLDVKFYDRECVFIPNPFDRYWQIKGII